MSVEKSRPRPRRTSLESEEERAWVGFYRRVGRDPAIASEVLAQLESDPEMKRSHLALYLCCKESLRQHKARLARNKRIGQFVRWLCIGLFIRPLHSLQKMWRQGSDLAVECLPEVAKEPAVTQGRRLARETEFMTARTVFDQQTPSPAPEASPASTETQASARAKISRTAA
ncbi:hypothetical protein PTW32_01575 [Dechloromonas agitata]|uniref:hypothetical protein n=1 Tax=Dechloromonas agitata TaxID=73030 RepID=UPI00237DF416|nr:hypothetical protein [Dechloromonas agitata]MDE1544091.1 hypothetical protein [Dechloromonas agitata]